MVFNATFNNISVIPWRSALFVEGTRGPGEDHRPVVDSVLFPLFVIRYLMRFGFCGPAYFLLLSDPSSDLVFFNCFSL
jgi:hypothetical protein